MLPPRYRGFISLMAGPVLASMLFAGTAGAEGQLLEPKDKRIAEEKQIAVQESGSANATKPAAPVFESEAVYLMDRQSGTVLFEQNAREPKFPASITKIVTGIVALESGADLQSMVTVSAEARQEEGTRVYLLEGEQQTLDDLIQAMLINSGNDAATAVAEFIDGTKEKFAERMNSFIRDKIGVTDSRFTNPHGLPDEQQITTAADMAKIAQYAMGNEKFRSIVGTKKRPWSGAGWSTDLENHNMLLGRYEGTTGVKNGFTKASGFTLVASAERDGMELIGVILKAESDKQLYKEMQQLLDYGFNHFEPRQLLAAGETYPYYAAGQTVQFRTDEPVWTVLPKQEEPELELDYEGNLTVISSLGEVAAGKLKAPLAAAETAEAGGRSQDGREIAQSQEPEQPEQTVHSSEAQTAGASGKWLLWGAVFLGAAVLAMLGGSRRLRRRRRPRRTRQLP